MIANVAGEAGQVMPTTHIMIVTARSDWLTVPLCKECHQDGLESVHNAKKTWLEKHGPDWLMAIRLIKLSPFRDLAPMKEIYEELPSVAEQDKSVIF